MTQPSENLEHLRISREARDSATCYLGGLPLELRPRSLGIGRPRDELGPEQPARTRRTIEAMKSRIAARASGTAGARHPTTVAAGSVDHGVLGSREMRNLEREIHQLVASFVDGVNSVARQAVIASFGIESRPQRARVRHSRSAEGDRSTTGIEKLGERFRVYVAANPGLRIEQIGPAIGASSRDLTYPVRKLVQAGAITKKGNLRATRYFARAARGRRRRSR
jgi:hypothetical protein